MEREIKSSTAAPMCSSRAFKWSISRSKCRFIVPSALSTELAGDVVFGFLARWPAENLLGAVDLDQLAEIEERREVRAARRLLHVVSHDDDRVVGLQLV